MIIVSMMAAGRRHAGYQRRSSCAFPRRDASQCALGAIVGQADPAIVEKAAEVIPAPEHVVDRLQDLGGAGEGFAVAQQPGVHALEKRLALFLAHGAPLVGATAVLIARSTSNNVSNAWPIENARTESRARSLGTKAA
ncbi:hypothetical protein J2R96_001973 [Bradyrhizobium elkanii]|nr:hypothetical protein [Bradyrhizobium elkanii]